jgi:hypothetical protein
LLPSIVTTFKSAHTRFSMVRHTSPSAMSLTLPIFFFLQVSKSLTLSTASSQTIVPRDGVANIQLFDWETKQLTNEEINGIIQNQHTAHLADIIDSNNTGIEPNFTTCKTFPGDTEWPGKSVWDDFNGLLGGSLIETVPIASLCYSTKEWGPKNIARCNVVTSSFTRFPTQ